MKRLLSSCSAFSAGCRSCGGRFVVPRAFSTSLQSYASTSLMKSAARKGEEFDPHSILKPKEKATASVNVDLPEEKKQVSLCNRFQVGPSHYIRTFPPPSHY